MTVDIEQVHAERRNPASPEGPTDLHAMARELLEEAGGLASHRSARTLTPGAGAVLKQTLMALTAGARLQDHVAPGPTTLLGIVGTVMLSDEDGRVELAEGGWAPCPRGAHSLEAVTDAAVLITVAPGM
jgi:quercetin dioxygenase-like cupin family protein